MRKLDVLVSTLSELTGRDEAAVAQTFTAILSANPEKGEELLAEIPFGEASLMYFAFVIGEIGRDFLADESLRQMGDFQGPFDSIVIGYGHIVHAILGKPGRNGRANAARRARNDGRRPV